MVHVHLKWYILKILDKRFWGVNLTLFGKKKQTGNHKKNQFIYVCQAPPPFLSPHTPSM